METSSAIECIHYSMMMMMMVLHFAHNLAHQASQDKRSGLQPGDEIESMEFLLTEEQSQDLEGFSEKVFDIKGQKMTMPELQRSVETLKAGTKVRFKINRNGNTQLVEVPSFASDKYFSEKRGIALTRFEKYFAAPTWSEAFSLGAKQVVKDASRVLQFLKKLVTGGISAKHLGGPGTIATVATSEASRGYSRLLLFLTLLSANLAIVNFLPIPVLDGGHMMFLAYEGLFRRPAPPAVQNILVLVGFVLIIGLMLFVITMDIFRFLPLE